MFHNIPRAMKDRMTYLEGMDARDRGDKTPHLERLRQIPPETGRFLALMAAGAPAGAYLEIGTSAGYSALWIVLALQGRGIKLKTFEVLPQKLALARETFHLSNVEDSVVLIEGDAREYLGQYQKTAFCFLDAEKDVYEDCCDSVIPNLVPGGILLADNLISHADVMQPFLSRVTADPRVDSLVVPIGKGVLVCRKI
ncbi:MAG: O-methyltransferase [Chloroflexota bacterium]